MINVKQVIDGLNQISLAAQYRDKLIVASEAGQRQCGNCYWWMKSRDCPAEHNVGGMSRGPSSGAPACGKFRVTQSALDLKAKREAEAEEFAQRHGLRATA